MANDRHPDHPGSSSKGDKPRLRLVTTSSEEQGGYLPTRHLDELRGVATIKRNLQDIIETVRTRTESKGRGWLGGTLLYGPIGCGKVFSVEVVAGELGVPLHVIDLAAGWDRASFSEVVEKAREQRAGTPLTVAHFENIDAPKAADLLAPLLPVLDAACEAGRLVVMASATLPWLVSNTIARPGRLGRVLLVLPPDEPSRESFLRERLEGRGTMNEGDLGWLVTHTDGHSFSDLEHLIEVATHNGSMRQIDHGSVRHARQAVPPSSAEWLSLAGHHAIMNEHGGMYDDLLTYFHIKINS